MPSLRSGSKADPATKKRKEAEERVNTAKKRRVGGGFWGGVSGQLRSYGPTAEVWQPLMIIYKKTSLNDADFVRPKRGMFSDFGDQAGR